jgi:hypothetical protein
MLQRTSEIADVGRADDAFIALTLDNVAITVTSATQIYPTVSCPTDMLDMFPAEILEQQLYTPLEVRGRERDSIGQQQLLARPLTPPPDNPADDEDCKGQAKHTHNEEESPTYGCEQTGECCH